MAYPYPVPTNVSGFPELFTYVNISVADGFFGILTLLAVFIITLISMSGYEPKRAILGSLTLTTMASIFLALLGLVNPEYLALLAALTAVSTLLLYRGSD